MSEEIQPNSENQEVDKDKITYKGTLKYYMRHTGIEEGAHAVYWNVKKDDDAELQLSNELISMDSESNEGVVSTEMTIINKNLNEINQEDILKILVSRDHNLGAFEGDLMEAAEYCQEFIDGALFPINKVMGEESEIKFGFVKINGNEDTSDFAYSPEYNTIFVNWDSLAKFSKEPFYEDSIITTKSNKLGYQNQPHEKRAITWQISDARVNGLDDLADMLVKLKNSDA